MIKPDGVQRQLVGEIIGVSRSGLAQVLPRFIALGSCTDVLPRTPSSTDQRFERRGYSLVGMKMVHASKEHIEKHYEDLAGKPFYPGLCK
jgi:nucleoside diphosphate kinase